MWNRSTGLYSMVIAMAITIAIGFAVPGMAQQAQSLDEVLRAMQNEREAVAEANQEREQRFRERAADREAELRRVRNEVSEAESEASRLEDLRNQLDRELEELRILLEERQG